MTVTRRSPQTKRRLLERAQTLADERCTRWRVFLTDSKGNALAGWRIVDAPSAERAVKLVRRATKAHPCLSSSEWRNVYMEVGL